MKVSGASMKVTRASPRPQSARAIKTFGGRADGPHRNPVDHPPIRGSNELAADAVRKASDHNGKIDPRQQPDNLN